MTRKLALTSNGPLAGKSTLAKHLESSYGFIRTDHSRSLVSSFVLWANNQPHPEQSSLVLPLTVERVYRDKELYRVQLQEHGYRVGFNDSEMAKGWVLMTLGEWLMDVTRDVVFDSFRGEGQAQILRDLGFELVQINIKDVTRCDRARAMGKTCSEVLAAMEAAPELELGIERPDIILVGELPVEVLGRVLMHRTEEARGIQVFGNQV